MNEHEIFEKILEKQREINQYDDGRFHFDFIVTHDMQVMVGDLHINENQWSQFDKELDIIYQFSLHPAYTTQEMETAQAESGDPITEENRDEVVETWKEEAYESSRYFAAEMASAIVSGEPIDQIYFEMKW